MRRLRISSSLTILVITAAVAVFAFGFKAGAEPPLASPSGVIVAPATPTDLEVHVVDDALMIEIRWQDNADNEDSYVVERSTDGEEGPWSELAILLPDSSNYYDVGLEDGMTYWYRVAAVNSAGASGFSNVGSGTATALPTPPVSAPAAPTELEAHVVHDALMIEIRWQDNADNEGSYVIERSLEGEAGPWSVLAALPPDSSNYYDSGLQDGVTYWYRVAAVNSVGTSGYSNLVSGTATALPTPPLTAPAAPADLEVHVVDDALMIEIRWQDNADNEDSYVVERSTDGEEGPWSELAILLPDSSNYYDSGLQDGVTYWYRVAAVNSAGASGFSNVGSGTATALPTPPPGDADCDGSVNSVDAALVLQFDAGLLSSTPCIEFADVNDDGAVDAIDAALLLQFGAGLIPSLPS